MFMADMKPHIRSALDRYRHFFIGFIVTVIVTVAFPAKASVIEGVRFENNVVYQSVRLELKGTALLKYMRIIKAYVGAIYLPSAIETEQVLDDVPKRLVLEYFRSIKAEDFRSATSRTIRKNISPEAFSQIEQRLAQLNALYQDVEPKDRYALTYIPGYGTELALNAKPLGVIPGADLANALFSIWIGPQPIDQKFRKTLLGLE